MKIKKKITKLAHAIWDELYSEYKKPMIEVTFRAGSDAYGMTYVYEPDGILPELVEICILPHWAMDNNDLMVYADTIVHEFVHVEQAQLGRKLNHARWFKARLKAKMLELEKAWA